jgi:hypothetical protein
MVAHWTRMYVVVWSNPNDVNLFLFYANVKYEFCINKNTGLKL